MERLVGDMNAHPEEWFRSSTTNLHGKAARDFDSISGWEQMITAHTYIDEGVLGLGLTDFPNRLACWNLRS